MKKQGTSLWGPALAYPFARANSQTKDGLPMAARNGAANQGYDSPTPTAHRVATVLRGATGRGWKSLELKENNEQHEQHEKGLARMLSP